MKKWPFNTSHERDSRPLKLHVPERVTGFLLLTEKEYFFTTEKWGVFAAVIKDAVWRFVRHSVSSFKYLVKIPDNPVFITLQLFSVWLVCVTVLAKSQEFHGKLVCQKRHVLQLRLQPEVKYQLQAKTEYYAFWKLFYKSFYI